MIEVLFKTTDGEVIRVAASEGTTAMRAAIDADVPGIDGDCGGACSCATCHVFVLGDWLDVTGPASETERDMIEFEGPPASNSRLACQIELDGRHNGLELQVAPRG